MKSNIIQKLEKIGLYLSIFGSLFMSILGISFGLFLESEAILLDGFFNVISFMMALASLYIAWLVRQPEGKQFQFGYLSFIPLVNLSKALLIFILSLFALFSAITALLHGGRMLNPGMGVIYAIIASSGCLIIAISQHFIAKKTGSSMVIVDAKNWLINGLISLSVGIAFGFVTFTQRTSWSNLVPYADPIIVTVLVLITLPVPIKIIIESSNQILLGAPESDIQQQLRLVFHNAILDLPCEKYWLRMTQAGQNIYLHIFWLIPEEFSKMSLEQLDNIRKEITKTMEESYNDLTIDIIFTQDAEWMQKISFFEIN
ncbi:MAG TPA: cation transporter [Cyanothece sp. UBA12306]|nr:cation transporter [Cyanothece sp. UBA12306]